jgi:hypothetical protein
MENRQARLILFGQAQGHLKIPGGRCSKIRSRDYLPNPHHDAFLLTSVIKVGQC